MPTYREATLADLPAICRLGREINAIHHAAWPDIFTLAGDPRRDEALWRPSIGAPAAITFVAEEDGEGVVAFANASFVAAEKNPLVWPVPHARVGSVGVAQSHRGRGIGRALMGRIEAWAAARGARHVSLNVWAFNRRAVALYEELGYEVRSHSMGKRLGPAQAAPMPVGVPRPNCVIRPATPNDAQPVSELVHMSFVALSALDWSPAARERFLAESAADRLRATIPEAVFAAVAVADDRIVGFVLMPTPRVLGMLFVHPQALRQGIARSLWEAARAHVETRHPEVTTVELNSTPYAIAAYRAFGFAEISQPFDLDGCVATRMACWLPARRLTSAG